MINASGIIKDILNGKLTYTELLRDVTTMQQLSSNVVDFNFIVNQFLAMGCRLILNGENVQVVPNDAKIHPTPPDFMRIRPSEALPLIRSEPFAFLPNWDKVYARLEIMLQSKGPQPMTTAPFREILSMKSIFQNSNRVVPSQMVCFPVICLLDGSIKLIRMSLHNFSKTPRDVLNGAPCIIRGKSSRKQIVKPTILIENTFDTAAILERNAEALAQLESDYSGDNVVTIEQAQLLRNLLDSRKRDASAIQSRMSSIHSVNDTKGANRA